MILNKFYNCFNFKELCKTFFKFIAVLNNKFYRFSRNLDKTILQKFIWQFEIFPKKRFGNLTKFYMFWNNFSCHEKINLSNVFVSKAFIDFNKFYSFVYVIWNGYVKILKILWEYLKFLMSFLKMSRFHRNLFHNRIISIVFKRFARDVKEILLQFQSLWIVSKSLDRFCCNFWKIFYTQLKIAVKMHGFVLFLRTENRKFYEKMARHLLSKAHTERITQVHLDHWKHSLQRSRCGTDWIFCRAIPVDQRTASNNTRADTTRCIEWNVDDDNDADNDHLQMSGVKAPSGLPQALQNTCHSREHSAEQQVAVAFTRTAGKLFPTPSVDDTGRSVEWLGQLAPGAKVQVAALLPSFLWRTRNSCLASALKCCTSSNNKHTSNY